MKISDLTLIIPILNEQDELPKLFKRLNIYHSDFRIIFCDAGSKDNSLSLLTNFCQNNPNTTLLTEKMEKPSILKTILLAQDKILTEYTLIHPVDISIDQLDLLITSNFDYMVFFKKYESNKLFFKIQALFLNWIDLNIKHNFVWTNALTLRTALLKELKLFKIGFLEDVVISDHLKKNYQIKINRSKVSISTRRYLKTGIFIQFIRNFKIDFGKR